MKDRMPGKPFLLETRRFRLESHHLGHLDDTFLSWWNDEEIQDGLCMPPRNWGKRELIEHAALFNYVDNLSVGIFCRASGRHIGFTTIRRNAALVTTTNTIIGDKTFWGSNVVLEVRGAVLKHIFEETDTIKVSGKVDGRNFASIYNYRAQGFKVEGIRRQHLKAPDGSRRDQVLFGLLKQEWVTHESRKIAAG